MFDPSVNKITCAIQISKPDVRFALSILLSDLATTIALEQFDTARRKFGVAQDQPDILIIDEHQIFGSGHIKEKYLPEDRFHPRIIAVLPEYLAARYFMRLKGAGISICPILDGLTAVVENVRLIKERSSSMPETTIYGPGIEDFLRFGDAGESTAVEVPDDLKSLLPRLFFTEDILRLELALKIVELDYLKARLLNHLRVSTIPEVIHLLKELGINQFPDEPLDRESKLLSDQALSVIAKWRTEQLRKTFQL